MHFKIKIIAAALLSGILIESCNKQPVLPTTTDSPINFYNGSYTISQELSNNNIANGPVAYILFDTNDSAWKFSGAADGHSMPYFGNGITCYRQYPNDLYNSQQPAPWTIYMHTNMGSHTVNLLDTARHPLLQTTLQAGSQPATLYFSDSLGQFRSMVTVDEQKTTDGVARIRLVHLSPDAGQVYARVNGDSIGVLGNGLGYMQSTPYQEFASRPNDTIRVKLYSVGDNKNILTRTTIQSVAGHSYTLVLNGYYAHSGATYTAPGTGSSMTVKSNLQLLINKTY